VRASTVEKASAVGGLLLQSVNEYTFSCLGRTKEKSSMSREIHTALDIGPCSLESVRVASPGEGK